MKYFAALPLVAGLAAAQSSVMSMAVAAAPSSTGPTTHTVIVGGMKAVSTGMAAVLAYTPEAITANVGDTVEFQFMQKNHTVTQSSFAEPCKKLAGGVDSGFMPNPDGKAGVTFSMQVNTTDPQWFYCRQQTGTHCGHAMTFSINAATTGNKTMAAFKQLAVQQNGTALTTAAIAAVGQATAAAAASTVTVLAGGASAAAAASASASVVAGTGTTGNGQACTCECLCGMAAFPAAAAQNNFGGFAGMIA